VGRLNSGHRHGIGAVRCRRHRGDEGSLIPYSVPAAYDWNRFYTGGHLGYAWGNSNWMMLGVAGPLNLSQNLSQRVDSFDEAGSVFAGLQAGYDYMLPNRFVIGGKVDASFPSFPNILGYSIGGISPVFSSPNGLETCGETV
jgi:high affinity Mn2+ porin